VEFLQAHPLQAPLIFLAVYALSVVCLIPTLPLNLGAGLIWGPYEGGLIAVLGASMGAALAFLIARHISVRYFHARLIYAAGQWFRHEIECKEWKTVAFGRMNPVFPFGLSSYCFGLTPVSFRSYVITTVLAILPLSIVIASVGHSIGSLVLSGDTLGFMQDLLLASLVLTVLVLLRIAVKRPLRTHAWTCEVKNTDKEQS